MGAGDAVRNCHSYVIVAVVVFVQHLVCRSRKGRHIHIFHRQRDAVGVGFTSMVVHHVHSNLVGGVTRSGRYRSHHLVGECGGCRCRRCEGHSPTPGVGVVGCSSNHGCRQVVIRSAERADILCNRSNGNSRCRVHMYVQGVGSFASGRVVPEGKPHHLVAVRSPTYHHFVGIARAVHCMWTARGIAASVDIPCVGVSRKCLNTYLYAVVSQRSIGAEVSGGREARHHRVVHQYRDDLLLGVAGRRVILARCSHREGICRGIGRSRFAADGGSAGTGCPCQADGFHRGLQRCRVDAAVGIGNFNRSYRLAQAVGLRGIGHGEVHRVLHYDMSRSRTLTVSRVAVILRHRHAIVVGVHRCRSLFYALCHITGVPLVLVIIARNRQRSRTSEADGLVIHRRSRVSTYSQVQIGHTVAAVMVCERTKTVDTCGVVCRIAVMTPYIMIARIYSICNYIGVTDSNRHIFCQDPTTITAGGCHRETDNIASGGCHITCNGRRIYGRRGCQT